MKKINSSERALVAIMLFIAALLMVNLCSCRVADFTLLSTKNFDSNVSYEFSKRVSKGGRTLKVAVDKAIEAGNGCYLTNVVIYDEPFGRWRVKGDVWKRASTLYDGKFDEK